MTAGNSGAILVVDDEEKILNMVRDYLTAVGFHVHTAVDGRTALQFIAERRPDLVVLDVMMPGLDGWDVVRRIREQEQVPIIMLTARAEEQDRLMGLELGADDYVVKPFSLKELAARIRAVLRRTGTKSSSGSGGESEERLQIGALVLDRDKRTVFRDGTEIRLTAAQFDLLAHMMQYPGRVFTRSQLLEALSDHAYEGYERTIDVHVKNIRKAVEADPAKPVYLLTVWGFGYKMSEERDLQ
jgi:DNA-binding response OmpR family regulator